MNEPRPEDSGIQPPQRLHHSDDPAPAYGPLAEPPDLDRPISEGELLQLSVYEIEDNPYQPRRDFTESEIVSLAESLKEHDMLQPILVRRVGQRWQLISGERRLRAAIHAGWTKVPARVRQADDRLVAELAIVENLQRKDLNPIEKALSFRRYLDEHGCTQDDLGRRLKIDRSTIANLLRLLELPEAVQKDLQSGVLSAGHARALLPLGDEQAQIEFAERIRREGLSVREVERQVQEKVQLEDDPLAVVPATRRRRSRTQNPQLASLEQQLRVSLGTRVDIKQTSRTRGQIVIHFRSAEEFERLCGAISQDAVPRSQSYAG
jgi:ParB family chromosome partitioning protein